MSWALKRQFFYIVVFFLLLAIFGFIIIYPRINREPTCVDNRQNGAETGVDCGGSCARACNAEVDELSVLWARAFKVIPGRYNAVAYIENKNKNAAVNKINYRFRFADKNNTYIGKREGSTYIPPSGKMAIFEPGIDIGNSIPVYTTFEFTQSPVWVRVSGEMINQLKVLISNVALLNEKTSPMLSATIKNNSLFVIDAVDVVVILYDKNNNAVSASRTYLDSLAGEEQRNLTFTWPEPFSDDIIVKEIIPQFNIFSVKLK